ncbi:TIGR03767 family metallophosphoesterase [Cellulomonas hominis]
MTPPGRRLVPGDPGAGGWRALVTAPGGERVGGTPSGTTLVALVHLSDLHLCDAESPARQEYLDHHGDLGAPYAGRLGTIGTYRPQEILTVQVAAAALRTVHRLDAAPVTGAPLDAVLVTGDVTDNAQQNELAWYTSLMTGHAVAPRSGDRYRSSWVGARDAGGWWPHFWHPDGTPAGETSDLPTARYGYPLLPGLVEAARTDVRSPGLGGLPWYGVHGNHDALLQGTVVATEPLRRLAVGGERVTGLGTGQTPLTVLRATAAVGPADLVPAASAPRVPITADRRRAPVGPGDFAVAHLEAAQSTRVSAVGNAWACDVGQVRLIALDTVNPHGGWQGSLDEDQLGWLADQLDEASGRYVVITSHHPSWTLTNPYAPAGAAPRATADDVLALLLRHPGVVAWVAGHVHAHTSLWHQAPDRDGGLWELTTSSLIDWPQQLRVLELVRETGGVLALASTVLDHAAPATWDPEALDDPLQLAAVSRTLAVNDYRARTNPMLLATAAGRPEDTTATYRLPDPHR